MRLAGNALAYALKQAKAANHQLVRINGGLRGRQADEPDDHFCVIEGCTNDPVIYEFTSDEFICEKHFKEAL
jgi:hypothetical protein